MTVLATGIALFLIALAGHIALWRFRPPQRSGQGLIALFVFVICGMWLFAIALALASAPFARVLPGDPGAWLQSLVLALALAAAYVMTYPALEVVSPTLFIIETIARSGRQGIAPDDLKKNLDNAQLVAPRVKDLAAEGLVTCEDGRYRPTAKGIALARLFTAWRRVIGAGKGG